MILLKKQVATKLLVGLAVVGGALSPVIASAATDSTTVNATVNSAISVSSSGTVAISVTPDSDGAIGTGTDTVTVDSNDADGYTLALKNADASLEMTDGSDTIAATSGTVGATAALNTNSWGFRVPSFTASQYAGVTATDSTIKSTTGTANADVTSVEYAVNVNLDQPDGVYTDTVTYTATAK